MQVLRRLGPHPRPEAGGHHHSCELSIGHGIESNWGARIRTWDRGTKTRCLTTWLRPPAAGVPPNARAQAAARRRRAARAANARAASKPVLRAPPQHLATPHRAAESPRAHRRSLVALSPVS